MCKNGAYDKRKNCHGLCEYFGSNSLKHVHKSFQEEFPVKKVPQKNIIRNLVGKFNAYVTVANLLHKRY